MDESKDAVEAYRPAMILDTNIWLDLLVFNDPAAAQLNNALAAGQVRILAGNKARDELADVISRPVFGLSLAAQADCLRKFEATARLTGATAKERSATATRALQCTDPDDQQFLDLAIAAGVDFLLSKDKALLKLARRAWRDYRFRIMTLTDWNRQWSASAQAPG